MNWQDVTDRELVSLIRQSNEEAFAELYRRHWKDLYRSAAKRTVHGDDAKDILQELFLRLWTRRMELPEMDVSNYLFTALRYRIVNYFQANALRIKHANLALQTSHQSEPSNSDSILYREDIANVIIEATGKMPVRMKEVFMLQYTQGCSIHEISVQLSINSQSVRNYLAQARNFIRAFIARENPEIFRNDVFRLH